jgi:hypothetical protein
MIDVIRPPSQTVPLDGGGEPASVQAGMGVKEERNR